MDTIFAQSTAPGRAGIAVIRLSGPDALAIAVKLIGKELVPRTAQATSIFDPDTGGVVDFGVVLYFPAPASFTGENTVEFQIHGSLAVVDRLLGILSAQPNTRLAVPGEFTRRALENNRIDLIQAEGIADLIEAETAEQLALSADLQSGRFSDVVAGWRRDLVHVSSLIASTIDFADEDLPESFAEEISETLERARESLSGQIDGFEFAERIRQGFVVAIVGAPNVGKSTLLNRLSGRDAAITSDIAGTTRDVIEVRLDLEGVPVTLLDTAGLRRSDDKIESIGVNRAIDRAKAADLRVFVTERDEDETKTLGISPGPDDIVIRNKADLNPTSSINSISALTGDGVQELTKRICRVLKGRVAKAGNLSRQRQRSAAMNALEHLDAAALLLNNHDGIEEILSEEVRAAITALDSLVGKVDAEDVLDEVFASFCIGK